MVTTLWLGGQKGNRTDPPDSTGLSLRKFPIIAVPVTVIAQNEPGNAMFSAYLSICLSLITHVSRFYLFKCNYCIIWIVMMSRAKLKYAQF